MIKPLLQNPAIQRIAAPLSLGLLLLLVWQLSFQQMNIPVYIVPKPSDIAMSMINQSGLLFGSLWVTLKITMLAFACAVIIGTLVAFLTNTTLGLRSVNKGLLNLFQINKASRWQILMRLRVPNALPYFFGGLRISCGLALIGAVVSEFVAGAGGTSAGLAYQILQAGFQLDLPLMFAALFLITCTGLGLFVAMSLLSRIFLNKWHESEQV